MPPTAAADDQLQLIDTTHPASKKFRTARGALNRHRAEQHAAKKKADDKENEILAIIRDDMACGRVPMACCDSVWTGRS